MTYNGKELHQGSVSDDGEDCVMLICAKDDIRGYAEEHGKKISEDHVDRVFARIEHKGSDFVMEQFWFMIEHLIDDEEVEND